MDIFSLLLKYLSSPVLFSTCYNLLKTYELNIFSTGKISTEKTITLAAATRVARLFIAVNVS